MVPMDAIWFFQPFPITSWLFTHHPPSHPMGVLVVSDTPVKNYLRQLSQLFTQQLVNRKTINSYNIMANFMQVSVSLPKLQLLKLVFLNIYNCAWKPSFPKSSHIQYLSTLQPKSFCTQTRSTVHCPDCFPILKKKAVWAVRLT